MKKYNSPVSLRVSKKLKKKLERLANKDDMNMTEFLVAKIEQEYDYADYLSKLDDACEIMNNIVEILQYTMLDKNNNPYDEFSADIIELFYVVKNLPDNIDIISSYLDTKHNEDDGSKIKHISLRLKHRTIKKLNYIADLYDCKKSDVIPLLLKGKDTSIMIDISRCFCYITDIRNYFYKKHIDNKDFEKEYNTLWKLLL